MPVLITVIPDYWEKKKHLNLLAAKAAENRASKDIAGDLANTFDEYVTDTEELSGFYAQLLDLGVTLDECKAQHEQTVLKEDRRHQRNHFLGGLAYTAVASLAALIIGFLFGQQNGGGAKATPTKEPVQAKESIESRAVTRDPPQQLPARDVNKATGSEPKRLQ